jgi:hypothetical protein
MNQYNADALHHSVNDIYEQLDEGRMTEAMANEILLSCCKAFIQTIERNTTKEGV